MISPYNKYIQYKGKSKFIAKVWQYVPGAGYKQLEAVVIVPTGSSSERFYPHIILPVHLVTAIVYGYREGGKVNCHSNEGLCIPMTINPVSNSVVCSNVYMST